MRHHTAPSPAVLSQHSQHACHEGTSTTCNGISDQLGDHGGTMDAPHLHFQPRSDSELVLAAGDKDGHVSLWHATRQDEDVSDGVHLHKPHTQYVSGLCWCPKAAQCLYSSS